MATVNELLTEREMEVLTEISNGSTLGRIARTLFVSESTIKCHAQHIYRKLGVCNSASAMSAAYRTGLLLPDNVREQERWLLSDRDGQIVASAATRAQALAVMLKNPVSVTSMRCERRYESPWLTVLGV